MSGHTLSTLRFEVMHCDARRVEPCSSFGRADEAAAHGAPTPPIGGAWAEFRRCVHSPLLNVTLLLLRGAVSRMSGAARLKAWAHVCACSGGGAVIGSSAQLYSQDELALKTAAAVAQMVRLVALRAPRRAAADRDGWTS